MGTSAKERRECQRTKINWHIEYTGVSRPHGFIHEGTKLVDYSEVGACFLTMADLQVGMQVTLHINLPVRMARPLVLKGEVVRIDEEFDVGKLFRAVAVRWIPTQRRTMLSDQRQQPWGRVSSFSH